MNNVFGLGGEGGGVTPAERGAVQTLFYGVGLCCWQKNYQREALLRGGRVSPTPPFAVGPRQMIFIKLAVMRNTDLHVDPTEAEKSPRSLTLSYRYQFVDLQTL